MKNVLLPGSLVAGLLMVTGAVALAACAADAPGSFSLPASSAVQPAGGKAKIGAMYRDANCGQVLVTCLVNGVPARLLMDTGATHTVLDKRFADEVLKVEYVDTSEMQIQGNAAEIPGLTLGELQAGGAQLRGMAFLVMSLDGVNSMQSVPIDGILGMDAMRYLPFVMDFANNRYSWGSFREMEGFVPLEGELDEGGRLMAKVKSGKRELVLLLDTGSSVTTMLPEQWEPGLAASHRTPVADISGRRMIEVGVGHEGRLQLGKTLFSAEITPQLLPPEADPGLLGIDALQSLALVHKPDASGRSRFYVGAVKPRQPKPAPEAADAESAAPSAGGQGSGAEP